MDTIVARATAHLETLEAFQYELLSVAAVGRSDCGRVTATVDASGAPTALAWEPGAGGDAARLGALICQAAERAAADVAEQQQVLTDRFVDEFTDTPDVAGTADGSGASELHRNERTPR